MSRTLCCRVRQELSLLVMKPPTNASTGLTTFIIGKALDANNIHISRAVNVNMQELQTNSGDRLSFDTGCGGGYDEKGICGPYWSDANGKTTYTLNNYRSMTESYHDEMKTMFGNWTTGDLLFGGASRCQASGGLLNGDLGTTIINAGGSNYVTLVCLSSAKACTFNPDNLDIDTGFTDCPSQPGYVANGCSGIFGDSSGSAFEINVPNGYLGAYLTSPTVFGAPETFRCFGWLLWLQLRVTII